MSVTWNGDKITIEGNCGVEEAETLLGLLLEHTKASVDLAVAGTLHTALWQVLLALSPTVYGEPADPFACQWLLPLVTGQNLSKTASQLAAGQT